MSLIFNWEILSQKAINEEVKQILNSLAQNLDLPSFLKSLEITEIDFGAIPPKVCIKNVADPLPEFYFPVELSEGQEEVARGETIIEANEGEVQAEVGLDRRSNSEFNRESVNDGSNDLLASFLDMIKDEGDFQIELFIEYSGDMKVVATAVLSADSPLKNFISLPITFTLSEISISGEAILAFIGDRINLSFKEPPVEGNSIIRNIKVESEIGSKDKQVLKNIDRIERYIVISVRKLINERLVFPNNHSFILS